MANWTGWTRSEHDVSRLLYGDSIYVNGMPRLTFYGVLAERVLRRINDDIGEEELLHAGIWRKIDESIRTVDATRVLRRIVDPPQTWD